MRATLLESHVYGGNMYGPGVGVDLPTDPTAQHRILQREYQAQQEAREMMLSQSAGLPEGHPMRQLVAQSGAEGAEGDVAIVPPMSPNAPPPMPGTTTTVPGETPLTGVGGVNGGSDVQPTQPNGMPGTPNAVPPLEPGTSVPPTTDQTPKQS